MSKTEDMLLVSRVVIADVRRAYETLMLKYKSSVRRFLLNLTLGDGALADDLAQETFIKAYLHLRSFQGLASFSSWLFRIAYNCFFDSKRASKRFDEWNLAEFDKIHHASLDYLEEKSDIYTALKLLREEERVAVLLCYMEDKTHQEAAKIMNLPLGTVKTHILKGKEKMEKFLTQQGYGR